jgi:DNA invertase Pin-like site-specific DNA recombinase
MKKENAVIYVRVSTDKQAKDLLNKNQEKRSRAYCQQKGLNPVSVSVEGGESARSDDMPPDQGRD